MGLIVMYWGLGDDRDYGRKDNNEDGVSGLFYPHVFEKMSGLQDILIQRTHIIQSIRKTYAEIGCKWF